MKAEQNVLDHSHALRGNASTDAPRSAFGRDAERPGLHSHAERGNDRRGNPEPCLNIPHIPSSSASSHFAAGVSCARFHQLRRPTVGTCSSDSCRPVSMSGRFSAR
ncbi:hypothetical protein CXF97_19740 [Pseudomonas sp. Choline-02u-1]|nr:hypothetical protein CXF97_19740 [Pseudomonas sp. Choline-02u-1]